MRIKFIKQFISYPFLLIIAIERYFNTIHKKALGNNIFYKNKFNFNYFIHRFLLLDSTLRISAEDEKLCIYKNLDSEVESFSVTEVSESVIINPGESIIFTVLNRQEALNYLSIEILFFWLLKIKRSNKIDKEYIFKSFRSAKKYFSLILDEIIVNNNRYKFSKNYKGRIQFYENREDNPIKIFYSNSIIFANKSSIKKESKYLKKSEEVSNYSQNQKDNIAASQPQRILIFYLDNISRQTSFELLSDSERFPNLSRIFNNKKFIRPKQTCTISNWTFPAAISMSSCKRFENHMVYHPELKPYTIINQSIYNSNCNRDLELLLNTYTNRFRCGTNWRMKPEHGLHYFYQHCMHNLISGDLYDTFSQAIKQIDIASTSKSIHWIDIMDSHHPVKFSLLPFGAKQSLSTETLKQGLHYRTGPKTKEEKKLANNYSLDIYNSQLVNIDRIVGSIIDYSYSTLPKKDHLLLFVSDHGYDFLDRELLFETLTEKHNSLLGFYWEDFNPISLDKYSNLSISPSDILPLLQTICFDSSFSQKEFKDYKYSQIFYPGAKYEFIYFYNSEIIYRYQTKNNLPNKKKSFEETLQDKYKLKNILQIGHWHLIDKDGVESLESKQLPLEIDQIFENVINSWLSFPIEKS